MKAKQQQRIKKSQGDREKKRDKADRAVLAPSAISRQMNNRTAVFSGSGREIRIKHREYLKELTVTTDAAAGRPNVTYLECNPGLFSCFPWLSGIANQFESYTFNSLALHYVPSCSSSTNGSIILAPDFDVSDYTPDSLMTLQTFPGSVRTSPWVEARMNCPPGLLTKLVKERMIRSGDIEDVDLKLYDVACLYIAHIGFAAAMTAGSLWIEYDVTLRTPSIDTTVDSADSARLYSDAAKGAQKTALFGTPALLEVKQDLYQPIIKPVDGQSVWFERAGQYLLELIVVGTGLNDVLPTITFPNGGGSVGISSGIVKGDGTAAWFQFPANLLTPTVLRCIADAAWTTVTAFSLKAAPYKSSYGV